MASQAYSIFGSMVRWRVNLMWLPVAGMLLSGTRMAAQQGVTTFGLQVKPVLALPYFDPLTEMRAPALTGTVELQGGMAYGMSIRVGLTPMISLETGIGQIQRRYSFTLANDTIGYREEGQVRYVGYEIPINMLTYIRTGERSYMNAAIGFSADLYPSDVQRQLNGGYIYMFRNRWVQLGVVGNVGWEYRTPKSGTVYIGATFHRPFGDMAVADLVFLDEQNRLFPYHRMRGGLSGSYLTADFRYYFHEDPDRVRRKKKK